MCFNSVLDCLCITFRPFAQWDSSWSLGILPFALRVGGDNNPFGYTQWEGTGAAPAPIVSFPLNKAYMLRNWCPLLWQCIVFLVLSYWDPYSLQCRYWEEATAIMLLSNMIPKSSQSASLLYFGGASKHYAAGHSPWGAARSHVSAAIVLVVCLQFMSQVFLRHHARMFWLESASNLMTITYSACCSCVQLFLLSCHVGVMANTFARAFTLIAMSA